MDDCGKAAFPKITARQRGYVVMLTASATSATDGLSAPAPALSAGISAGEAPACVWGFGTRSLVLIWALCGSLVFADEAAEDGSALYLLRGEADDRVGGPGRAEPTDAESESRAS